MSNQRESLELFIFDTLGSVHKVKQWIPAPKANEWWRLKRPEWKISESEQKTSLLLEFQIEQIDKDSKGSAPRSFNLTFPNDNPPERGAKLSDKGIEFYDTPENFHADHQQLIADMWSEAEELKSDPDWIRKAENGLGDTLADASNAGKASDIEFKANQLKHATNFAESFEGFGKTYADIAKGYYRENLRDKLAINEQSPPSLDFLAKKADELGMIYGTRRNLKLQDFFEDHQREIVAEWRYACADAMLEAREKKPLSASQPRVEEKPPE